ncbi:MAG: FAD-dependent oxidoreductase [Kiloniellales bacterium]
MTTEPRVIVVGAGAAGIGAARRLREIGVPFNLLEARNRLGGRACSDTSFPAAFDLGCSWLWGQETNPLVGEARALGFELEPDDGATQVYFGDRPADDRERESYHQARSSVFAAIEDVASDTAVADVAHLPGPYARLLENSLGPWMMGEEIARVSTGEWEGLETRGTDYLVPAGLGTLVARVGDDLSPVFDCPVQHIDWSGTGVVAETSRGQIRAAAAIVTVPVGVLASGGLRLTPDLPDRQQEALAALPMGVLNKVALAFERDIFGLPANSHVAQAAATTQTPYWIVRLHGQPMAMGLIGGEAARALEREGEAAAVAYALGTLQDLFGSQVEEAFQRGRATAWGKDPFALGAYSVARPGGYRWRGVLGEVFDHRLFLAGEAAAPAGDAALVGGAFSSGVKAAEAVLESL